MAKIFIAYRFTGEDPKELGSFLGYICDSLKSRGHDVFCSFWLKDFFRERCYTTEQIYEYCLNEMDSRDTFLAVVKSEHKSDGMRRELEKAKSAGKRYILAIKEGLDFQNFRETAHKIIEYTDIHHLAGQLELLDKNL